MTGRRLLAALVLLAAVTGCGGSPAPRLSASTTQFRFNEGTDVLRTGVVNEGSGPVRIETAALHWPGFDGPVARVRSRHCGLHGHGHRHLAPVGYERIWRL